MKEYTAIVRAKAMYEVISVAESREEAMELAKEAFEEDQGEISFDLDVEVEEIVQEDDE